MKKGFITTCLIILSSAAIFAQDREIRGTVTDPDGAPIQYGTVILQDPAGNFVDAVVTDSLGVFSFRTVLSDYRLIVQHLLYEQKEIESSDDNVSIRLDARDNAIDEVVVRGERPLVKATGGILAYDVDQVTQGKAVSSAYDAVLELPGVREENGAITLAGAGGVTIILNGRPTTMSHSQVIELLKQMPVSSLETAEVMYSAPPQYHVRGSAINLVLTGLASEDGSPVWQGEVNGAYTQNHYANYKAGTSLLYTSGKLSADFLYTYSRAHSRSGYDILSHHTVDGKLYEIEQRESGNNRSDNHTGRLGIDFRPNDDNLLTFTYNTSVRGNNRSLHASSGNFSNSSTVKTGGDRMHNLAFDYTSGFGFKAGLNYTYYNSPSTQHFFNLDQAQQESSFVTKARQNIDAMLFYADQSHTLKREWELTYGAKFYYANDHDYQRYHETTGDIEVQDTDSRLKEYIADLYVGTGKSFTDRLSMNVSLTGEYYRFARDDDWAFFPQASLSYMHSPQNILQFSFSSDKRYPGYWDKQDYIGYMDGYTEFHGNPNLKAYNYYSAQLTYILKSKYIFNLFYNYAPDYAVQLAYQSTDRLSLVYKTLNWDFKETLGIVAVIPFRGGEWLSSRFTFQGMYEHAKSSHFHDISFDKSKLIAYFGLNNTFNVSTKPDIKLELSANYMTSPMQGLMDLSSFWTVNAGARWIFANEKAELRLRANDIFDTGVIDIHSHRSGQNLDMLFRQTNRSVVVSFAYKFGGYKEKQRKEVDRSRFGH